MSPRVKGLLVGLSVSLFVMVVLLTTVLAVDLYLHRRYERDAGLNRWGYRGPVVGRKQYGERRVAVVGGSTAFGYGVTWQAAIPALLEQKLNARPPAVSPYTVVNLAYNNEGAYSFKYTLRDYAYLDYDLAVLYTGYNDASHAGNKQVFRHDSPVFTLTGYLPIFPIIFQEKAMALRHGGDLEAAYRDEKTVFTPNTGARMSAAALETAVRVSESLERQLGRLTGNDSVDAMMAGATCAGVWEFYCDQVTLVVDTVLAEGKRVIVVTQPYISDSHMQQQKALIETLERAYGYDTNVRHVNLGNAIALDDFELAWDGMHLTAAGNDVIAARLVEPVIAMLP